ncbi:hypothetical protein [Sulfuricurvum sp.]|jgi:uncharacterized protein YoxC|uniref:hypothetical protein n=1 Tax=Sulfuricurvum sp. TaxID=2025608 RepID=UPI00262CCB95|nr:hypothetical protein [Sulfuricurvum sp.]MDD2265569.1 hypothetical protein [Sulfuricurvum sp.]MDD2783819.1 hypothetical protein [Sulfuricurvum sp.]HZF69463.1 hypothetical protein [Sulfuricurvum sp.]
MNHTIEIALIALAVMVVGLIYYVITKEGEVTSQIRAVAKAVEDLHRELFMLDKRLKQELEIITSLQESVPREQHSLHAELGREVNEISIPILESLGQIEGSFSAYKEKTENRLRYLEERIRNLSLPTSISGLDDEKVISRYNQGVEVDAIAKELRLSKAEVEFVLKINQLR